MKNYSKKAIRNLVKKRILSSKKQNTIIIIAIILTSLLFTSVFTLSFGLVEQMEYSSLGKGDNNAHGAIKFLTQEQYKAIEKHPLIKEIGCEIIIGSILEEQSQQNTHTSNPKKPFFSRMIGADEIAISMYYATPLVGTVPQKEYEILLDEDTLSWLGVPKKVGTTVTLEFQLEDGSLHKDDFVLSGYYKKDPRIQSVGIYTSLLYAQNLLSKQPQSADSFATNSIQANIMFSNKHYIVKKLEKVIVESGYSINESDSKYLSYDNNPAYIDISNFTSPFTIAGALAFIALIILAGYLIIYNIFQISITENIQSYGLLKVVGTTKKQTKSILWQHALVLALIGIPVGLITGFFVGTKLLPFLIKNTTFYYEGMLISITPTPIIGILASLLTFLTIWLSLKKPNRIASKVSPLQALKFQCISTAGVYEHAIRGAKIFRMAQIHIMRNKKQIILTIASLSLSLVLLNSVFSIIKSFDMEQYLADYIKNDFYVAHPEYFQFQYDPLSNALSEKTLEPLQGIDGFTEGFTIYNGSRINTLSTQYFLEQKATTGYVNKHGHSLCSLYATDIVALERMPLIDGEINSEKLNNGTAILEPVLDFLPKQYKIGDMVKIYYTAQNGDYLYKEVEIIGHVQISWFTDTSRYMRGNMLYTSTQGMYHFFEEPAVMSYSFNVSEATLSQTETWLQNYTSQENSMLAYESLATHEENFQTLKLAFVITGSILSCVIGLISMINFINSILTSILARRIEFAILESIGMTKKQLKQMLSLEGLLYALGTAVVSITLSTVISVSIIRFLTNQLRSMTYQFTLFSVLLGSAILVILGVALPVCILSHVHKKSILEKLRALE